VTALATSTFLQVLFAAMIVVPVMILWVAAVVDVVRGGGSGVRIAVVLVLILIVPILGPLLYFVFRRPPEGSVEERAMAAADMRREVAGRAVGGPGPYR
jgi:hypothetical protein